MRWEAADPPPLLRRAQTNAKNHSHLLEPGASPRRSNRTWWSHRVSLTRSPRLRSPRPPTRGRGSVLKKARGDEAYTHYEKLQRRFQLKTDIASQVAGRPGGDGS